MIQVCQVGQHRLVLQPIIAIIAAITTVLLLWWPMLWLLTTVAVALVRRLVLVRSGIVRCIVLGQRVIGPIVIVSPLLMRRRGLGWRLGGRVRVVARGIGSNRRQPR